MTNFEFRCLRRPPLQTKKELNMTILDGDPDDLLNPLEKQALKLTMVLHGPSGTSAVQSEAYDLSQRSCEPGPYGNFTRGCGTRLPSACGTC